jgi:hypothetical protein
MSIWAGYEPKTLKSLSFDGKILSNITIVGGMMRTRVMLIALVLVVAVAVPMTFATGVGAAFALPVGDGLPGSGAMLSLKVSQIPFLMGFGFSIGQNTTSFGVTGDWWIANRNLFSFVNYYMGPGFYLGYSNALMLGGRFPLGINIFPIKPVELFLEIAPTLTIGLGDPIQFPIFGVQGAFGARFWF